MARLSLVLVAFCALFALQALAAPVVLTVTVTVRYNYPPYDGELNPYYISDTMTAAEKQAVYDLVGTHFREDMATILGLDVSAITVTQNTPDLAAQVTYFGVTIADSPARTAASVLRTIDTEFDKHNREDPIPSTFDQTHFINSLKFCTFLADPPLTGADLVLPAICPSSVPVDDGTGTGSNSTVVQPCGRSQVRLPTGCSTLKKDDIAVAFGISSNETVTQGQQAVGRVATFFNNLIAVSGGQNRIYFYKTEGDSDADYDWPYRIIVHIKTATTGTSAATFYSNIQTLAANKNSQLNNRAVNGDFQLYTVAKYSEEGEEYPDQKISSASSVVPSLAAGLVFVAAALLQ